MKDIKNDCLVYLKQVGTILNTRQKKIHCLCALAIILLLGGIACMVIGYCKYLHVQSLAKPEGWQFKAPVAMMIGGGGGVLESLLFGVLIKELLIQQAKDIPRKEPLKIN